MSKYRVITQHNSFEISYLEYLTLTEGFIDNGRKRFNGQLIVGFEPPLKKENEKIKYKDTVELIDFLHEKMQKVREDAFKDGFAAGGEFVKGAVDDVDMAAEKYLSKFEKN